MTIKQFLFVACVYGITCTSCEDIIDPTLQEAAPVLVIDAWINDKPEDQVIKLSLTQPYLQNELPLGVSDATITISYDGGEISFTEDAGAPGVYRWATDIATSAQIFGTTGSGYQLTVTVDGETFTATSRINRTVSIDSITFKIDDSPFYPDNSYVGEFWAKDAAGSGDTYWIKTFKNGVLLNKPSELNVAFDAAFSEGGNFDGLTFIPPIRSINPDEVDEDDQPLSPYEPGDSVYVEIHSVTRESFNYLNQVIIQTDRPGGFGELFSTSLSNVSCNIKSTSGKKVVGFFNVSAVEGMGKRLK